MDAIAAYLGMDRTEVRGGNFIQPDEFPYDHGLIFQDGRPLIYDSGDYPASLAKLKELVGWDEFAAFRPRWRAPRAGRSASASPATSRAPASAPTRARHVHVETSGKVKVATGLTTQGQGHQTVFAQIVADELGVPFEDVEVVTGDTRRMPYAVGTFASRAAVMSGIGDHLAARGPREKALRIAAEALEADPSDLEIVDGVVSVKGAPGSVDRPRHGRGAVQPAALRLRRGVQGRPPSSPSATRASRRCAEDDEPGLEGKDYYSPERSTFASGMHAVIVETDPETAEITILQVRRRARLRPR